MRVSEVYGLTWDCIDFDKKTITINKNIIKKNQFGLPKRKNITEGISVSIWHYGNSYLCYYEKNVLNEITKKEEIKLIEAKAELGVSLPEAKVEFREINLLYLKLISLFYKIQIDFLIILPYYFIRKYRIIFYFMIL